MVKAFILNLPHRTKLGQFRKFTRFEIVLRGSISFYQKFISPGLGRNCRFFPSCSQYSYLAIQRYGLLKGLFLSFKRVLKCHPWHRGGIDMP